MILLKADVKYIPQEYSIIGMYKQIELAGRTCYKSNNKITVNSYKTFIERLKANQHYAMLEFGTIYLHKVLENAYDEGYCIFDKYNKNPYSKAKILDNKLYVTTNYRVLVENGWEEDLKYFQCTDVHDKRYMFRIITDRGVSHELVRHRVFSFAQESTRFCNYNSDKFNNELSFIIPSTSSLTSDSTKADNLNKLSDTDRILLYSFSNAEENYKQLISEYSCTPQQARAVLPNSLKTEICMTGFLDDWLHFLALRLHGKTGKPHPDMLVIAKKIDLLLKNNVAVFNMKRFYFKMTVNGNTIDVNCMAKTKQEAELLFVKTYQDIDKLEFIKFE